MGAEIIWCQTRSGDLEPGGVNVHRVDGSRGELLLASGKPDWALDPRTGARVRFKALLRARGQEAPCPACSRVVVDPVVLVLEADVEAGTSEWVGLDCPHCRRLSFVLAERGGSGSGDRNSSSVTVSL